MALQALPLAEVERFEETASYWEQTGAQLPVDLEHEWSPASDPWMRSRQRVAAFPGDSMDQCWCAGEIHGPTPGSRWTRLVGSKLGGWMLGGELLQP